MTNTHAPAVSSAGTRKRKFLEPQPTSWSRTTLEESARWEMEGLLQANRVIDEGEREAKRAVRANVLQAAASLYGAAGSVTNTCQVSSEWSLRASAQCEFLLKSQLNKRAMEEKYGRWQFQESMEEVYSAMITTQIVEMWSLVEPKLNLYASQAGGEKHVWIDWKGEYDVSVVKPAQRQIRYTVTVQKDYTTQLDQIERSYDIPGSPLDPAGPTQASRIVGIDQHGPSPPATNADEASTFTVQQYTVHLSGLGPSQQYHHQQLRRECRSRERRDATTAQGQAQTEVADDTTGGARTRLLRDASVAKDSTTNAVTAYGEAGDGCGGVKMADETEHETQMPSDRACSHPPS